jgi:glycosyltransferase involved in cell wall biosynthesis
MVASFQDVGALDAIEGFSPNNQHPPGVDHQSHEREPELTVLMPCLNEARTLATCIRKAQQFLREASITGEVLIADNGSTDGSQELALSLGARVVHVPSRGYGAALIAGIRSARGRFIAMGDSDDSYDFRALGPFVSRLKAGDDLVIGNRFRGGIQPGAMPWHHRFLGNPVLTYIGRQFFKSPVGDFHCGLRAFRREAIARLELKSTGMEFASEMIVKASLAGLHISEVPTTLFQDGRNRPPHLRSFRDGWRHLRFLLLHCPRWLFLYPGVLMIGLGIALQVMLVRGPLAVGQVVFDIHTLLYAAAATIMGVQITLFGLLSHLAASRLGILPRLPERLTWAQRLPLEYGLIFGLALLVTGVLWAGIALVTWAEVGFAAIQPTNVMRSVIPSVTLMILGVEVFFASFFVSILGLEPTAWPERIVRTEECAVNA